MSRKPRASGSRGRGRSFSSTSWIVAGRRVITDEPALARMIRASYELLGRISFFTVGEDECRAWTIRRSTVARKAAGTIHSDIEKGFIRAEVVAYEKLIEAGSWAAAKEAGTLRLEGKEYVVLDGDIAHFRFNV